MKLKPEWNGFRRSEVPLDKKVKVQNFWEAKTGLDSTSERVFKKINFGKKIKFLEKLKMSQNRLSKFKFKSTVEVQIQVDSRSSNLSRQSKFKFKSTVEI